MWTRVCSAACSAAAALCRRSSASMSTTRIACFLLKVHEFLEPFERVGGETLFVAGEPVQARGVADEQGLTLLGGQLFGDAHRLLAVVRPVGIVEREVAAPHQVGGTQLVPVLHRGAVVVEAEPHMFA